MLVLTHLDLWFLSPNVRIAGAGNQSLLNTLLGYANAGYEVHMITTSTLHGEVPSIHDNVHVHRRTLPWFDICRKLAAVPRSMLRRIASTKQSAGASEKPRDFVDFSPPGVWYYANYFFKPAIARHAIALARKLGGVDFIYGHEILGAIAAEVVSKKLGVPLVTRFQGTELSQFLDQPKRLMQCKTHVVASRVDADLIIMANDGTLGNRVLDFLGIPKERYRFYINGVVKDNVYRPRVDVQDVRNRFSIPKDTLFLLYAGRMFYWKRIDRLLNIMANVKKNFDDFRLIVVGDGPELAASQAMAEKLKLSGQVRFVGAMAHRDLMDPMNACDVYVSFHDLTNLCNPVIESCVCGNCIVTTAIGGTKDLLTDKVNAIVHKQHDDVDGIAEKLLDVLKHPEARNRLAEAAFQRGRELKTWAQRMEMEVAEVEKVIATAKASQK